MTHSKIPALFIGHGSPQNAIEDNEFARTWSEIAGKIPRPDAIVSISAHWQTDGVRVTSDPNPKQMYDFYGFPHELHQLRYPVEGSPALAAHMIELLLPEFKAKPEMGRGIDHGTWSVLCRMYPKADIPVVQLSQNVNLEPEDHWRVATKLRQLRNENILVIGSGNIVHNLGKMMSPDKKYDWAVSFDKTIKEYIDTENYEPLKDYRHIDNWQLAIPSSEHFLPLLYILALKEKEEKVSYLCEKIVMGSISMRSLIIE